MTKILFFGSTNDSIIVLNKLVTLSPVNWSLCAIVTQPPRPIGRSQIITPTPVELWAKEHTIATLSFESNPEKPWLYNNTQQVIDALQPIKPDLLISASYGQMIPSDTIAAARYGGLNVHPSILPRWRGGDPVPWAILSGDHQIGVTVVALAEGFDEGDIIAQKKIPITPTDTSNPLRTTLFGMGAELLVDVLPTYLKEFESTKRRQHPDVRSHSTSEVDKSKKPPYAKRLTRDNGFESWDTLMRAVTDGIDAERIDRKFRALDPWPGVWTTLVNSSQFIVDSKTEGKRLKILKLHLSNGKIIIDEVQLEGKKPVRWKQFAQGYLPTATPI